MSSANAAAELQLRECAHEAGASAESSRRPVLSGISAQRHFGRADDRAVIDGSSRGLMSIAARTVARAPCTSLFCACSRATSAKPLASAGHKLPRATQSQEKRYYEDEHGRQVAAQKCPLAELRQCCRSGRARDQRSAQAETRCSSAFAVSSAFCACSSRPACCNTSARTLYWLGSSG